MLYEFLEENRADLVERCRAKVGMRPAPRATPHEMEHGVPLFLEQLIETLRIEHLAKEPPRLSVPGAAKARDVPAEITASAVRHGQELLRHGFAVDQVVHDYGDLCQAVTELAIERSAAVSTQEFHTLNRCLDDAIADAVTAFGWQHDRAMTARNDRAMSERLGNLAHEFRNYLNTAILSFAAIKRGSVGLDGSTAAVLDRALGSLKELVDGALTDVRLDGSVMPHFQKVTVERFVTDLRVEAGLEANARQCEFAVGPIPRGLTIEVDRPLLHSAVANLLQNAFKFTRPRTQVWLNVAVERERVQITVEDRCGGLPAGAEESMFKSFEQHHADRSGLGLGLSIAQRAVAANDGKLSVRSLPGVGCRFTIDLPLATQSAETLVGL